MTKLIIFDCWGTLFTSSRQEHPFSVFARKLGYDISDRAYLKCFEKHLMLDGGDIDYHIRNLLQDLRIAESSELVDELTAVLTGSLSTQVPYPDTMQVLDELAKKYQLALLSNTFSEGFAALRRKYPIDRWFEVQALSYALHMLKPDSRLYEHIQKKTSLKKEEFLMVGDNYHDDVLAAHEAGIPAVLLDRRDRYPHILDRKITSLAQLAMYIG